MYGLIKIFGLLIRQFLLPNPFESIWPDYANILNAIMGILLLPVSYVIVGSFYNRHRDGAAFGSFMFNVVYICLSFVIWGGLVLAKLISDNWVITLVIVGIVVIAIVVVAIIIKRKRLKVSKNIQPIMD